MRQKAERGSGYSVSVEGRGNLVGGREGKGGGIERGRDSCISQKRVGFVQTFYMVFGSAQLYQHSRCSFSVLLR